MRDPIPANIEGQKVVSHEVQHSVNWGYVAVAVVALVLVWKLGLFGSGVPNTEDEGGYTGR